MWCFQYLKVSKGVTWCVACSKIPFNAMILLRPLQCEIDGEWDVVNDRNMTFTLHNHEVINRKFLEVQKPLLESC